MIFWRCCKALAMTSFVALLATAHVNGDTYPEIDPSTGIEYITIQNQYVACNFVCAGQVLHDRIIGNKDPGTPPIIWEGMGRFGVRSIGGNPKSTADDGTDLTYLAWLAPCGNTGFFKVKIDDKVAIIGDKKTGAWGTGSDNRVLKPTYFSPPTGLGLGNQGDYIKATWEVTEQKIEVVIRIQLIRDQVRFEVTLKNQDSVPHKVGLAMSTDVQTSPLYYTILGDVVDTSAEYWDNSHVYAPGRGATYNSDSNVETASKFGFIGTPAVPATIDVYDTVKKANIGVRYTLATQDATPPDYVVLGDYFVLGGWFPEVWITEDYSPDMAAKVDDVYAITTWNQQQLDPYQTTGRTKTVVTYYGIAAATEEWTYKEQNTIKRDYVVMAVQDDYSIKYDTTSASINGFNPGTFNTTVYLDNLDTDSGPYDLKNVHLSILLPDGLIPGTQADGTPETTTKSIAWVGHNSEESVSWNLVPTGDYSGALKYFVTASADNGWQQTVEKTIIVPATKKTVLVPGWQMIQVPYNLKDPVILSSFLGLTNFIPHWPKGKNGDVSKYGDAITYNYITNGYDSMYDEYSEITKLYDPVEAITPGTAFWFFGRNTQKTITLPSTAALTGAAQTTQINDQLIKLNAGWNMIGNPLAYPIFWGQIQVWAVGESKTYNLDMAVQKNWISRTFYCYNPARGAYDTLRTSDTLLEPWKGYWVYAKKPVTMIFSPVVHPHSDIATLENGN